MRKIKLNSEIEHITNVTGISDAIVKNAPISKKITLTKSESNFNISNNLALITIDDYKSIAFKNFIYKALTITSKVLLSAVSFTFIKLFI